MGVKGCAGELTQLEWDHLHTDRGYALISRADEYKKDLLSDRCILNPELSLELDAVWSSNSSLFLLPPNKNHLSVKPLIQSQVANLLATCLQRRAQRIQPLNRSRSQEVLLQCLSHGLVRNHFQRRGAGGRRETESKLDSREVTSGSEVRLILVSVCVCVCESDWMCVCSRVLSAPPSFLPSRANRLPPHFNYTHTPSSDQGDTDSHPTPPPTRAAARFLRARWQSSQSLYKLGPGRQKQDYLEEVGFIWKSSLSGLW